MCNYTAAQPQNAVVVVYSRIILSTYYNILIIHFSFTDHIVSAAAVSVTAAAAHVFVVVFEPAPLTAIAHRGPPTHFRLAATTVFNRRRPQLVSAAAASACTVNRRWIDCSISGSTAFVHGTVVRRRQSHHGRSHGQHVHSRGRGRCTSPVLRHRPAHIHRPHHRADGVLVPVRPAQLPAAGRFGGTGTVYVYRAVSRGHGRLLPGPRLRPTPVLLGRRSGT
jgi:hypothetical protein